MVQAAATTAYRTRHPNDQSFLGRNLKTLEKMLWGGSIMLIVDHILNGELTWRFPFFTALETAGGGQVMLQEMLTVGVPMSVIVTLAWVGWCYYKERKAIKA